MGRASMEFKEVRFVIGPELTEAYVLIEAHGDCPIGVQGWHHKTFPPSKSVKDIIDGFGGGDDPVMWPLDAPDPAQPTRA